MDCQKVRCIVECLLFCIDSWKAGETNPDLTPILLDNRWPQDVAPLKQHVLLPWQYMEIIFIGRVARAAALGGLGIPHGQQQFKIILMAPHQDGSRFIWSLDALWVTFPWVLRAGLASPVFHGAFWTHGRTNVAGISRFGEVGRHSGLFEFRSCALCHEVSHHGSGSPTFLKLRATSCVSINAKGY